MVKFESKNVINKDFVVDDWAQRYELAYNELFDRLSVAMQKRVLAVKDNPNIKDRDVDLFVNAVIELAENETDSDVDINPNSL